MAFLTKRPVAFRIKTSDGWAYFFEDEEMAAIAAGDGNYQGLYVRDASAIVVEWSPIKTAPQGDNDFFLVCGASDERPPFVVRGAILKTALKKDTPDHLGMGWLTHWMPLPERPV